MSDEQNQGVTASDGDTRNVATMEEDTPSVVIKDQENTSYKPISATENVAQVNREFQEKATLRRAHDMGLPYLEIAKTPLNPDFLRVLDVKKAKEGRIIPFFKVGEKLRVAVEDPTSEKTQEVVKILESEGYEVDISIASTIGMNDAFKIYDSTFQYDKPDIVETVDESTIKTYEKEIEDLKFLPDELEDLTAEEALNALNISVMKTAASDVHYEPEEGKVAVRFRIDGMLHHVFDLKYDIYQGIAEQIKYQSKMRLNVYTIPQDGRYLFNFNEMKIAVRSASIPTPYGEAFVCRYLPSGKKPYSFEELGFQGSALKKISHAAQISQGMVLITGPTGSGKSTTLYSILNVMNRPNNKVITLEDPVEYYMRGVTQSQIDEKNGYSFSSGLRSILRHDPDIIMLGEIRDLATAETASQAALTGHVLLSTLHTNSAVETIPRLINMGLPPFMVAPSLHTIVAQRLVRKICEKCATTRKVNSAERLEFERILANFKKVSPGELFDIPEEVKMVNGCSECSNTGYKGRVVLAEAIVVDSEIRNLVLNKASSVQVIAAARKDGLITMREDGFRKVALGITTLEEVYRTTNMNF